MRLPVFFLTLTLCAAQDNVPLPQDDPPPFPLEPAAPPNSPAPAEAGLPRVELPPRAAVPTPPGATSAPRVKILPKSGPAESSVQGGQFHIYGKVKAQRDVLLDEAENIRRMIAAALRVEPVFTFPIVVTIMESSTLPPGRAAVWSEINQFTGGGGFRFDIKLVPEKGVVPGPLLRQELVRCVLAEMVLRDHIDTDLSGRDVPPPDWLLYGTLELLDYQAIGRPSEAFSAVFGLGRVLSIDDIFEAEPRYMDSVSRMIYRSSCCGLLLMLMEQPGRGGHLTELFKALAVMSDDPATAIARTYPSLTSSGNSLGKWWSLQLATMAQPGMDELLGTRETEQLLARALVLQLPPLPAAADKKPAGGGGLRKLFGKKKPEATAASADAKKKEAASSPAVETQCPLEEFARVMPRKDRAEIFGRVNLALTQLSQRAHPLYRPVLSEYRTLIKNLTDGKKEKEAAASLSRLAIMRRTLLDDMQAVEDYMDWFEATQTDGISGAFDEYLRVARELARPPPPRNDPVSRYMDMMEREYQPED